MAFKKIWHVLIVCLGIMTLMFTVDLVLSLLEVAIFTETSTLLGTINRLVKSFVAILILKKLCKTNILKDKSKGFWSGIWLGSAALIVAIWSAFVNVAESSDIHLQPLIAIIATVCMFLSIGIYEELTYRGIILGVMDDYFGHKDAMSVWKTVILSGVLFGAMHFTNAFAGISFFSVSNQVIQCVGMGILFGAIYMRCRNLYSLMFLHVIYDVLVMIKLFISDISMLELMLSQHFNLVATSVLFIIYISASMFILRKEKMQEIIDCDFNKSSLKLKT